ncbi:MAG TPA: HigA family addiction module antitoxin [Sphaerochaeta sp.]|nr:HigA family addiction module antitoxin [Sphaerochaeta sp.]
MVTKMNGLSLEFIIHPGETLKEILEDREISQKELAVRTGVTAAHVSKIVNGQKAISIRFAKMLEYALDIEASFWINLQANYDREIIELEELENISQTELTILKNLHEILEYLKDLGHLSMQAFDSMLVIELRRLLRLSSLEHIPKMAKMGAYRLAATATVDPYVMFTWLRVCELTEERDTPSSTLNVDLLLNKLPTIKKLMFSDAATIEVALKKHLQDCGIRFSIIKHFSGAPIQGVIRQNDDGTLSLVMTNRGKFADIFWFSFFHELGHIIHGNITNKLLIDYASHGQSRESEADTFASETLMNAALYAEFVKEGDFSLQSIKQFASKVDVPAFIVIGRLQRDRHLAYYHYAEEKVVYEFA